MSIMLPIDRRKQMPASPRVHPSWADVAPAAFSAAPAPAKLDAAKLSRLWDAIDAD